MRKLFTVLSPILLFLFSACNNECQDLLDQVHDAKATFKNTATNANCLAYQSALAAYLNSSCQSNSQGVNYDVIFQDELDGLQCDTLPTAISTCANGVQDAGETGVDCGGACQPCGTTNNFYITFDLNGTNKYFDSYITTGGSSGMSATSFAESSTYLSINLAQPFDGLSTVQGLINDTISFENNSNEYTFLEFEVNSEEYTTSDAGNDDINSYLVVTSASLYNSFVVLGDTIDSYLLEGSFSGKIKNNSDTLDLTNGSFKLIF